jgi:protein-S-isoprenylcysteine O-methyltransferase Ste14
VSLFLMELFGTMAGLVVLNLAVRGLGLPFAAVLSRKLATGWLYARCRNPMGLMTLLFFLAAALWLRSLHAVVWVVCWLGPAWVLFVRLFEERELEIRFGKPYLEYKAKTPFFV